MIVQKELTNNPFGHGDLHILPCPGQQQADTRPAPWSSFIGQKKLLNVHTVTASKYNTTQHTSHSLSVTRDCRVLCVGCLLVAVYAACCYFWMHSLRVDCSLNYFLPYSAGYHNYVLSSLNYTRMTMEGQCSFVKPDIMACDSKPVISSQQWPQPK